MGIRRSAIQQAADNDPNVKHAKKRGSMNPAFVAGAAAGRRMANDMTTLSVRVPVATKPAKNKAAK